MTEAQVVWSVGLSTRAEFVQRSVITGGRQTKITLVSSNPPTWRTQLKPNRKNHLQPFGAVGGGEGVVWWGRGSKGTSANQKLNEIVSRSLEG